MNTLHMSQYTYQIPYRIPTTKEILLLLNIISYRKFRHMCSAFQGYSLQEETEVTKKEPAFRKDVKPSRKIPFTFQIHSGTAAENNKMNTGEGCSSAATPNFPRGSGRRQRSFCSLRARACCCRRFVQH